MTFGERLRDLRRAAGLTQEELAEAAGLAARSIRDLERDRRQRPQRRTLELLVKALRLADADAAALLAADRSGRQGGPPADDGAVRSGLLDRRGQLAVLDRAAGEARAGRGAVVLVRAGAGMGKTSLVDAWAEAEEARGFRVVRASGGELEQDFAFAVVRQLAEPLLAQAGRAGRERLLSGPAESASYALRAVGPGEDGGLSAEASQGLLHSLYWLMVHVTDGGPVAADGTITVRGRCIDVYSFQDGDGGQVELWTCNGETNEQWKALTNGTIYNPAAGKCLDTTPPSSRHSTPTPPVAAPGMSLRNCSGASSQVFNDDPPYLRPPEGQSPSHAVQTSVYMVNSAYPDKILCASRSDGNVWLEPAITRADPYCQWQELGDVDKFALYNPQKHQAVTYGSGGTVVMKDLEGDVTGDEQYSEWNGRGLGPFQDRLRWIDAENPSRTGTPTTDPVTTQSWRVPTNAQVLAWYAVPVPTVTGLGRAITALAANAPSNPAATPTDPSGLVEVRSGHWSDYILCADPADQWLHLKYSPSYRMPDPYCTWQHIGRLYGDGTKFTLYNPRKGQVMAYEGGASGPLVMENPALPAGNDQYFSFGGTEDWGARALQSFLDPGQNVDAKASDSDTPRPAGDPVRTRGWRNGDQAELTWKLEPTSSVYGLPSGTDCAPTSITSAADQQYVSTELGYSGDQRGMLRARAFVVGPWEQYDLCQTRGMLTGAYAIRSTNSNQYVTAADSNPSGMLRAVKDAVSTDEEFYISSNGDGTYSLSRGRGGLQYGYVTAALDYSGDQYGMLQARAMGVGPWEQFQ